MDLYNFPHIWHDKSTNDTGYFCILCHTFKPTPALKMVYLDKVVVKGPSSPWEPVTRYSNKHVPQVLITLYRYSSDLIVLSFSYGYIIKTYTNSFAKCMGICCTVRPRFYLKGFNLRDAVIRPEDKFVLNGL